MTYLIQQFLIIFTVVFVSSWIVAGLIIMLQDKLRGK